MVSDSVDKKKVFWTPNDMLPDLLPAGKNLQFDSNCCYQVIKCAENDNVHVFFYTN